MSRLTVERKTLWRLLRITGLLAGLGFMAWLLTRLLTDPQLLKSQFAVEGFIEAVSIGVVANAVIAIAFSDMVGKCAPDIRFGKRITAYYYAQIAKYIPGKVAALMVQRSVLSGPHATAATITSNLELMAISSWLCGSAAFALLVWPQSKTGAATLMLAAIVSGAWLLQIDWWRVLRLTLSSIPKYRDLVAPPRAKRQIPKLRSVLLSSAMLVLPAASSYFLLLNGLGINHELTLQLSALLLLSWVGGLLAFVFPAGIGIREVIFFALGSALTQAPETALMAGIALASRVVQIVIDIAGVLLFVACQRWFVFARNAHDKH